MAEPTVIRYRYYQPAPDAEGRTMLFDPDERLGRAYQLVYDGAIVYHAVTRPQPIRALERMWMLHNVDDRPRRQEIRSMCIGDVVEIVNPPWPDGAAWWIADHVGWQAFEREEITVDRSGVQREGP